MKRVFHWGWSILEFFVIIYVILITSLILCQNKYGYTEIFGYTLKNISKTEESTIKDANPGDLLMIKNNKKIDVNDNIYYYGVNNESYTIYKDSVLNIEQKDKYYTISRDNKDVIIDKSRIIGKEVITCPYLGELLEAAESRTGFLFFVLLPIMIVFVYQVYEFLFTFRSHRRDLESTDISNSKSDNSSIDKDNSVSFDEDPQDASDIKNENKSSIIVEETIEEKKFKFVVEDESEDDIEIL